jgi:hypothetical protein
MNSNKAVQVFKSGLRTLEMSKEGDNISGKILGAFTRTNFPIVRVPSNLVSETFNYTFGLPRGLIEIGIRNISQLFYKKGIEDISPEAADRLFRALKKGAVGTVLGIIGYTSADMIGGYYNPMDKKKTGDVKWGSMRIGDWDAPLWMLHSPPMETLQFYATLRKVHDYYNSKREDNSPLVYDIPTGLKRSSIGLIEQTPFMQEPVDVVKMFAERDQADIWAAEYVNGMLNPQISQQIARSTDKDPLTWESFWKEEPIKRKATGVKETLEKNVPGLRETLPTEEEANRKVKIDKFIKEYSQDKVLDKSSIRNFANVKIDLNDAQDKYDKILKDKDKDLALEQVEASGIGDKIEFLSKNKPLLDRFEKILSFYNKMELEEKYDYKIAVEDQLDEISDAYYSGDKIKLSKDIEKIESLIAQGEKERTQEKNYISKELK